MNTDKSLPAQYGIYRVDLQDGSHALVEAHTAEQAQGTAAGISGKKGVAVWLRYPTEAEQDGPGQFARYFPVDYTPVY